MSTVKREFLSITTTVQALDAFRATGVVVAKQRRAYAIRPLRVKHLIFKRRNLCAS
jgi:hypothetical protein